MSAHLCIDICVNASVCVCKPVDSCLEGDSVQERNVVPLTSISQSCVLSFSLSHSFFSVPRECMGPNIGHIKTIKKAKK